MKNFIIFIMVSQVIFAIGFKDALRYYKDEKYSIAYEKFYLLHKKNLKDKKALLYMAKSLYGLGEFKRALKILQKLSKDRRDGEVTLYLGKIYFELGKYKKAQKILKNIKDKKYEVIAKKYKEKIDKIINLHSFFVYIAAGLTYDDNIHSNTYEPTINYGGIILKNDTNAISDTFMDKVLFISHNYKIKGNSPLVKWEDNFFIFDRNGLKYSNENVSLFSLQSGPVFSKNSLSIKPKILMSNMYYESEHYMYSYGVGFNMSKKLNNKTDIYSMLSIKNRKYIQLKDKGKNASLVSLGFGIKRKVFVKDSIKYNFTFSNINKKSGNRKDVSKKVYISNLLYMRRFSNGFSSTLKASYKKENYKDNDSVLGFRKDKQTILSINITKKIKKLFDLSIKYTYTKNKSNESVYSYKKNSVGIMLSKSF